jgi:hypothetical protein
MPPPTGKTVHLKEGIAIEYKASDYIIRWPVNWLSFCGSMGVAMDQARRSFLGVVAPATVALWLGKAAGLAGQGPPSSSRPPFPSEPSGEVGSPKLDPRSLLKLNQLAIKKDVERLVLLAEELKKEVGKTDSTEVLSLALVRKAEEVEKLAKHIKSLARG